MKLKIDEHADALYFELMNGQVHRSDEVAPGIIVDYDEHGNVIGIEMLSVSKRIPAADVQTLVFETVRKAA